MVLDQEKLGRMVQLCELLFRSEQAPTFINLSRDENDLSSFPNHRSQSSATSSRRLKPRWLPRTRIRACFGGIGITFMSEANGAFAFVRPKMLTSRTISREPSKAAWRLHARRVLA